MAGADYFVLPSRWRASKCSIRVFGIRNSSHYNQRNIGLEDLKYNILKNDLLLCKNIKVMANLIIKLCERKDYKNLY